MEIYLLRHGIAEDAGPGGSDARRALTGEGREKLRRVLGRARGAAAAPSLILTSPLLRARQTAEIAAEALGYDGELVESGALAPQGTPRGVWEEICARRSSPALLLSGHEPLLSRVVAFLLGTPALQVEMKKGALVRIDVEAFGSEPRGVLMWMLTPKVAA